MTEDEKAMQICIEQFGFIVIASTEESPLGPLKKLLFTCAKPANTEAKFSIIAEATEADWTAQFKFLESQMKSYVVALGINAGYHRGCYFYKAITD